MGHICSILHIPVKAYIQARNVTAATGKSVRLNASVAALSSWAFAD
jgi:hypothetical protein